MTNQNPITPPPKLVEQWVSAFYDTPIVPGESSIDIATKAARWGADQELKACCDWADETGWTGAGSVLRRLRRPKPPSLKEQAIDALERVDGYPDDIQRIFRALEALD